MSRFSIDCTLPPPDTTFVNPPNARGTLDIVYSCLTVMVLCTWSVLHLNVPLQTFPTNGRQKLTRSLIRLCTKVVWMAVNILAPEWPFAQAVCGLMIQRKLQKTFGDFKTRDGVPWTGSHTQLADMGGFVISFGSTAQNSKQRDAIFRGGKDTRCMVDEYCCNRTGMLSPYSLWAIMGLRAFGSTRQRRSKPHDVERWSSEHCSLHIGSACNRTKPVATRILPSTMSLPDYLSHDDADVEYRPEAGLHSGPLPLGPSDMLRRSLASGQGCPHNPRTSNPAGNETWAPDEINTMIARTVVASLEVEHPKIDSLTGDFLFMPGQWVANMRVLCGNQWTLDAQQLAIARGMGIIAKLPSLSEDELSDLNKGDVFVKVLALSQIAWLCIQLSTRLARGLPTTQLEVVTLAFTVCSIITYCLLYSRPKDVQTVREVKAARYPTPSEFIQISNAGPSSFGYPRSIAAIPNNAMHQTGGSHFQLSCSIAMLIFGSLHCIAWNYEFPTILEKILWRASVVVTITVVPLMTLPSVVTYAIRANLRWDMMQRFSARPRFGWYIFMNVFGIVAVSLFVAARLFILAEVVRSLAYQPPQAFRNTWAASVPHVS